MSATAPALIASRLFSMAEAGIPPGAHAYAALLRRCAEVGQGRMAYAKITEMREAGVPPTAACLLHAASACLASKELGYARRLIEELALGRSPALADPAALAGAQRVAYGKLLLRGIKEFAK